MDRLPVPKLNKHFAYISSTQKMWISSFVSHLIGFDYRIKKLGQVCVNLQNLQIDQRQHNLNKQGKDQQILWKKQKFFKIIDIILFIKVTTNFVIYNQFLFVFKFKNKFRNSNNKKIFWRTFQLSLSDTSTSYIMQK